MPSCRRSSLADLAPDDYVLEVGPGIGTLTIALLKSAGRVLSVERDPDLPAVLAETLSPWSDRFALISKDALDLTMDDLRGPAPRQACCPTSSWRTCPRGRLHLALQDARRARAPQGATGCTASSRTTCCACADAERLRSADEWCRRGCTSRARRPSSRRSSTACSRTSTPAGAPVKRPASLYVVARGATRRSSARLWSRRARRWPWRASLESVHDWVGLVSADGALPSRLRRAGGRPRASGFGLHVHGSRKRGMFRARWGGSDDEVSPLASVSETPSSGSARAFDPSTRSARTSLSTMLHLAEDRHAGRSCARRRYTCWVGPGIGTLTIALLKSAGRVLSVERDPDLPAVLAETLSPWADRFALLSKDA